jgi:class 3 adenylate cyclase
MPKITPLEEKNENDCKRFLSLKIVMSILIIVLLAIMYVSLTGTDKVLQSKTISLLTSELLNESKGMLETFLHSILTEVETLAELVKLPVQDEIFDDKRNYETLMKYVWKEHSKVRAQDIGFIRFALVPPPDSPTPHILNQIGYYCEPNVECMMFFCWPDTGVGNDKLNVMPINTTTGELLGWDKVDDRLDFSVDRLVALHAMMKQDAKPTWLKPRAVIKANNIFVEFSTPLFNATNHLSGVLLMSRSVRSITRFLTNLETSVGSKFFVMSRNGILYGSSNPNIPVVNQTANSEIFAHQIEDTDNQISASASKILSVLEDPELHDQYINSYFSVTTSTGEELYVRFVEVRIRELEMIAVITVPAENILRQKRIASYIGIGVAFVVLIFSILAGVFVILIALHPLKRIIKEMSKVADMKLDEVNDRSNRSWLFEIYSIQLNFHKMVRNLREFRNFLPSYILDRFDEQPVVEKMQSSTKQSHYKSSKTLTETSSVHSGSSRRSSNASKIQEKVNRFQISLEVKTISMLYVEITNFLDLSHILNNDELIEVHAVFVDTIQSIFKLKKGAFERQNVSTFICTWNSMIPMKNHALNACQAAQALWLKISKMNESLSHKLQVNIVIVTGECTVGVMGTKSLRNLEIIGNLFENAKTISKWQSEMGGSIIISEETHNAINKYFVTRQVDILQINNESKFGIYEIFEEITDYQDEWMYELEQMKQWERFKTYNEAFEAFKTQNYDQALQLFNLFLQTTPNDKFGMFFKNQCEVLVKNKQPYICKMSWKKQIPAS